LKPCVLPFARAISPDFGVDLGTHNTRISLPGDGVVLDEPSIVAVSSPTGHGPAHEQAVGVVAHLLHGRAPESVRTMRPIHRGVVADLDVAAMMLRTFLRKARPRAYCVAPRVLLAVPSGITPVERQAAASVAARAAHGRAALIARAKAAAIGAALPLAEPIASMICDLGAGRTEIAVLVLGELVVGESLPVAGDDLDLAIVDLLRREHKLCVSGPTAEKIKLDIGAATTLDAGLSLEVGGRDLVNGLPRRITVRSDEVTRAIDEPLRAIDRAVERTLERCSPQWAADLMENGILLVGGGSRLRGLDRRVASATGMPVRVADDPASCVARGLATCLEHLDVWHTLIERRDVA
jgi:rod shape-determining protein MreB